MIIGISPVRLSFSGGGTDMPEFYDKYGGNVITTSINRYTYSIFHPRYDSKFQTFSPDFERHIRPTKLSKITIKNNPEIALAAIKYLKYQKGTNVIVFSDVPGGSGLGASSSLAVNLVYSISKLQGKKISNTKIAETAFHIGRNILKIPIGKQDEYIASFGGFNNIKFKKNNVSVNKIKINKSTLNELQENLMLFYIGDTRYSGTVLSKQLDKIKLKDKAIIKSLNQIKVLTEDMHYALKKNDLMKFAEILHENWVRKKTFVTGISTDKIDKIYEIARKSGAIGGKLTGAGGGGHMLFYCERKNQSKIIKSFKKMNLKHIEFASSSSGPKLIKAP